MSRRLADLAALARVTDTAFAAEQAQMAALRRREAELRGLIADLDRPRHDPATPIEEDAALRAGAEMTWQLWVDARRSALNVELARVLVAQAEARRTLARAFGRNAAATGIRDDAAIAARTRRAKREERGG